ncbi:uncharacterized protein [Halyomorpha halys]|uniref:uncharacterized protein n=1 Tax=Halyomorpha halys TaxID=286706 RepID=UPI0006D504D2|nr:uncharacterized protein LOC106679640 [Halyomorpha halys]
MVINPRKTKLMRVGKKPRRNMCVIRVKEKILKQVENFKYLGKHLNENRYIDSEVAERITAVSRIFEAVKRGFLNRQEVEKIRKVAVFRLTFLPILTYSSESWTLTEKHQSRIQASEMRLLLKIEGKTKRDRVRNTTIRSNLNIKPANDVIEEN